MHSSLLACLLLHTIALLLLCSALLARGRLHSPRRIYAMRLASESIKTDQCQCGLAPTAADHCLIRSTTGFDICCSIYTRLPLLPIRRAIPASLWRTPRRSGAVVQRPSAWSRARRKPGSSSHRSRPPRLGRQSNRGGDTARGIDAGDGFVCFATAVGANRDAVAAGAPTSRMTTEKHQRR